MNDLAPAGADIQTALLEVISEGISGALIVYDRSDHIVFASQQTSTLLQVPASLLSSGTRLRDFLGAVYDGGSRFASDPASARRPLGRDDWVSEQIASFWKERAEVVEKHGNDRWISFTKRRLPSGHGVCIVRDISELKKREEQWRNDLERVQITEEVLDNLPFGVTVMDRKHAYVAVNKAMSTFLDLPPDAILGHRVMEIHPGPLGERLDAIHRQVFETGEPSMVPEQVIRADGSEVRIVARKYRIGKPGRYYVVSTVEDVTAVTAGDGEKVFPVVSCIGASPAADEAHHEHPSFPPGIPALAGRKVLLVSDNVQAEMAAVKRLAGAGVDTSSVSSPDELEFFLRLAAEAGLAIDLVVIDSRMHIRCPEIAASRRVPGLNLDFAEPGLDVIEAVTARIEALSTEETGPPSDEDWQITADEDATGIDILVAEDNEVNQIVFSQILSGLGYGYLIAVDGEDAVRLYRERSPRLVLMDVTLPKVDGFEAAKIIRSLGGAASTVPIVGVLPVALDGDREACLACGMNDVILKPISPETLEAVIVELLGDNGQRRHA